MQAPGAKQVVPAPLRGCLGQRHFGVFAEEIHQISFAIVEIFGAAFGPGLHQVDPTAWG